LTGGRPDLLNWRLGRASAGGRPLHAGDFVIAEWRDDLTPRIAALVEAVHRPESRERFREVFREHDSELLT
jgi:hypothetical protein